MGWSIAMRYATLGLCFLIVNLRSQQVFALHIDSITSTATGFTVNWTIPANSKFHRYIVNVSMLETLSEGSEGDEYRSIVLDSAATQGDLMGLKPASKYNVTVIAQDETIRYRRTDSAVVWTKLGDPTPPPPPSVRRLENRAKIEVNITQAINTQGPISKYLIIVNLMDGNLWVNLPENMNISFEDAANMDLNYYITAELDPSDIYKPFIIGDNVKRGRFENRVLIPDNDYRIYTGIKSVLNDEVKISYSSPVESTVSPRFLYHEDLERRRHEAIVVFSLSVAIGILGFLLVASFIVYFLLRRHYSEKRRSDELILKIHDHNAESPYFGNGNIHLEEGADLNGFYSQLCDLYWQIPRPQLHITDTVLGQGSYGPVRIGKVLRNGQEIPAQIQRCGAHFALSDRDRRFLLSELEAMVRVGSHANVVEFIGGCEDGDALFMATEHPDHPLRGALLSSRHCQEGKICTLPEYRLMEIAISLSDAMRHLAHRGVIHGQLSTRSVMLQLPHMTPKVTNFSLARYTPLGKKLDFTRWAAPESRSRRTPQSDVWSFGVLLWELFTLGGTPYVDLKTNEVLPRITKGHRLPQPRGVDVSLFQLILHCWEMDPDERPDFKELSNDLRNIASEDPLRFPTGQSKYTYDRFDPLADEI